MRILLIEDHERLADAIVRGLSQDGFGVDVFGTAGDGINATKIITYDAVILDLGLPDRDGLEVLGELRRNCLEAPVLILTARDGISDRVSGLDAGADDYVVKPFAMSELAARLRALLRRPGRPLAAVLTSGRLTLDTGMREVAVDGIAVRFSSRETQALEMLMRREGQVVARSVIEDGLYGLAKSVTPNSIDVLFSRLRRKLLLANAGVAIHTLHGIGYLLKDDVA
jgi:DNA-binding response OmpR family regulator